MSINWNIIKNLLVKIVCIGMVLTSGGCIYHEVVEDIVPTEMIPKRVLQSYVSNTGFSLSDVCQVQTRQFKGDIVFYLFTYENVQQKSHVVAIAPTGELVFKRTWIEWTNGETKSLFDPCKAKNE